MLYASLYRDANVYPGPARLDDGARRYFQCHGPQPTMPQTFRNAGYQGTQWVNSNTRNAIASVFEVILCASIRRGGRISSLEREGYAEFTHAMGSNAVRVRGTCRSCHPTNWTTREMCYTIQRRDPTRPLSGTARIRHRIRQLPRRATISRCINALAWTNLLWGTGQKISIALCA